MTQARTCSTCGAAIPSHAPVGHCPACLLRIGLSPEPAGDDSAFRIPHSAFAGLRSIGDYELLEELASGGMGVVYKARQLSLNRLVAVKMIRAGQFANEAEVARFRSEAEAAAQLDHPNIVPIFEVGQHEGQHFFSMKLVEGGSLACVAAARESAAIQGSDRSAALCRDAATLLAKIARAIHYAHQRGILHRDLKPGNILLDELGQPHVTDFGLAARVKADSLLTLSGAIVGTPAYMAPEQAAGARPLTTAVDIYSLGAVLYEMLAGRPPFVGATVMETLQKVMSEEPLPPRLARRPRLGGRNPRAEIRNPKEVRSPNSEPAEQTLNPPAFAFGFHSDFGPRISDLDIICLKCLAKEPERRYGSAEALAEDLERWLRHEPIHARPATLTERATKWVRRNPAAALGLAGVALATGLGGAGVLWQWRQAEVARQDTVAKLRESYVSQARARRVSGLMGQRTESLAALRAAAQIKTSSELRNEAAAVLALTDLQPTTLWRPHLQPAPWSDWAADPALDLIAIRDHPRESIGLWHLADGTQTELSHDRRNGRELCFSHDGQRLAAGYYCSDLVLWNIQTGQRQWVVKGVIEGQETIRLDFSSDDRLLAAAQRTRPVARLFEAASGQERPSLVFTNHAKQIGALAFHPSEPLLAVGLDEKVELWDYEARRLRQEATFSAGVTELAWHPDGRRLAVARWYDPDVIVWDTQESRQRVLHGMSVATHLAFSPAGDQLACRGRDGATRLWDLSTDRIVVETRAGLEKGFGRNGQRLAFDKETVGVGVWEVVRSSVYRTVRAPAARLEPVEHVAFSPDGRWLVWSGVDGLSWMNPASDRIERRLGKMIYSVHFQPDSQSLVTCGWDGVQQWAVRSSGGQSPSTLCFDPPKTLLAPDPDISKGVRSFSVSSNGQLLAAAGEISAGTLRLDGTPVALHRSNTLGAVSVALDAAGRWLAYGTEIDGCRIAEARTGEVVAKLDLPAAAVLFDPKGRWLATGTVNDYALWEAGSWTRVRRHPRDAALRRSGVMAFSPDGAIWAVAHSTDLVRLLDTETGAELLTLTPPSRLLVQSLAFSPDGKLLAVGSENAVVQLWDLPALRRELATLGLDWNKKAQRAASSPQHP